MLGLSVIHPSAMASREAIDVLVELTDEPATDVVEIATRVWNRARAAHPQIAIDDVTFFAYVAESGEGGATVARQRAVEPGPVVGNDYVVKSGLKPGEKLIVSGVQKIGDGSPVSVQAAAASPAPTVQPGAKGD